MRAGAQGLKMSQAHSARKTELQAVPDFSKHNSSLKMCRKVEMYASWAIDLYVKMGDLFSHVCFTVQWPHLHANYVLPPSWCRSAFFHHITTYVTRMVVRRANNKNHKALPKSANIKTPPSTPITKVSFGLQNINNTNKLSRVTSCFKFTYLMYLYW